MGYEILDYILVSQDAVHWWALVYTLLNALVP
jgi:hypothetical protein